MLDQIILYPELDYVGALKFDNEWHICYDVLEMWILDYKEYRPNYSSNQSNEWRASLLVIDSDIAVRYREAMNELSYEEFERTFYEIQSQEGQKMYSKPNLAFVVDFDNKLFVNGWWELSIPFHKLIPLGWKGIEGNTYNYIPSSLKDLWQNI